MKPTAEDRRSATEDRLRAALAARAALVTHRDLRHDAPPQGRSWGVRRVRGVAFAVLGAAAAVAAGCLLLPGNPPDPAPLLPAGTPGISGPSPSAPASPVGPSVVSPGVLSTP
ncbi:hypothetical protein ABH930_001966 [Kitasatospora sp. GAS204A]|uniref:hypothetical protein n=1 Tax=unclassified Kitasatospora TaxID=2633591 RepID=UPI00247536B9|nr:hypothetical protein [Kitasatospora sp. GAS204B]MDH6116171.1 hypothetical protein [Kitasatospora sp. GAS204B]